MELQRMDEITKDLYKLYGEFCCELADRAKTDDVATICALKKINISLVDVIGGVRGLGFIELAKKLADEREKMDDITILCCIDRLISMNRFEIFGLNDEQEYFFANYDEVYNSITRVRKELCVLNLQLKKLKDKITERYNYELDEREKQCSDGTT